MSETRILEGQAACGELALDLSIYLEDAFLEEKEKKDSRILNPGAAEGPLLSQKAVVKASQQIRPRVPTRREGKTAPLPAAGAGAQEPLSSQAVVPFGCAAFERSCLQVRKGRGGRIGLPSPAAADVSLPHL